MLGYYRDVELSTIGIERGGSDLGERMRRLAGC
jgi:hypothetical protein